LILVVNQRKVGAIGIFEGVSHRISLSGQITIRYRRFL
jgi:hypothetical protein